MPKYNLAVLLLAGASFCAADTLVYDATHSNTIVPGQPPTRLGETLSDSFTLDIPRFDLALGTLTGIQYTLGTGVNFQVEYAQPTSMDAGLSTVIPFQVVSPSPWLSLDNYTCVFVAGTGLWGYGQSSASVTAFVPVDSWNQLEGAGDAAFSFSNGITWTYRYASDISSWEPGDSLEIRYSYIPIDPAPEPRWMALGLVVLFGIAMKQMRGVKTPGTPC